MLNTNAKYIRRKLIRTGSVEASMRDDRGKHCAKLDAAKAASVRARVACGESQRAIARELGVSQRTIWQLVRGETWKSNDLPR